MREIGDYGCAGFGPFSFHLKDGDPKDLPVDAVTDIVERWGHMVNSRMPIEDQTVVSGQGHEFKVFAPTIRDTAERKIYIQYIKTRPRPVQPLKFKFKLAYISARCEDEKKWWRRILG